MVCRGWWPFTELGLNGRRVIEFIVVGCRVAVGRWELSVLDLCFELAESSAVLRDICVRLLNEFGVMLAIVFDVATEFRRELLRGELANLE